MKTSDERINSINKKVKTKRNRRAVIWTSTVCACVFVALTVMCSLPILGESVPNINAYKNDEYYPIIKKINAQYKDNKYSIFSKLGELGGAIFKGATAEAPGNSLPVTDEAQSPTSSKPLLVGSSGSENNNAYEETTLNQVKGVTEGDLLKRSKTHAFYLKCGDTENWEPCLVLQVYKLAGSDTSMVAQHSILAKDETSFNFYGLYYMASEMFLNDDATRLTVVATCLSKQNVIYTTVISLDVSDVRSITEVNRVYVSGRYLSSRKVDGKFLIITNFNAGYYGKYGYDAIEYDQRATYIPQCGSALNDDYIPVEDIHIPDNCPNLNYTVLAMLDETTLQVRDSYATFSYSQDVYVSRNYLVVARNSYYYYKNNFQYGAEVESSGIASRSLVSARVCEMVAIRYGDKFEKTGEIGVDGYIKDRYCMDEQDGVLRVFVTSSHTQPANSWHSTTKTNVSLYCVDLSDMKVIANKENFAPQGDEVKSARFGGNTAYVCTARRNTDPVFYFDLSDLNNITCVDTGEIEGFSVNLVQFNDLLLGIGQGEHSGILKVELYKQSGEAEAENGVVGVAEFERECGFSYEPKSHFVDAEHNLIGLQVVDYTFNFVNPIPYSSRYKYLLLRFDVETNQLQQIYFETFNSGSDFVRAFYKDNGVYVFGTNDFTFIDLQ